MSGTNIVYDITSNTWYSTLSSAITGSSANDELLVSGGFVENFPNITHNLTIQAIGASLVQLSNSQPLPPNQRAILNVPFDSGVSLTISGLEIFGANNDSIGINNAAGILFEVGNGILTVNHSWIHDNEDGILTGGPDTASAGGVMSVFITDSEINDNGVPEGNSRYGFDHNIYAGALTELSVTGSYIHDALGGHEIKSRALTTIVTNNRMQDGFEATTSYSIDVPDGGVAQIAGNVIEKGLSSPNRYMVHFGGEGTYADSSLLVDDNRLINDRGAGATVVLNQTQDPNTGDPNFNENFPTTVTNNTIYDGNGAVNLIEDDYGSPADVTTNNTFLSSPAPPLDGSPPSVSRPMVWSGLANDGNLANAANWIGQADTLNPAQTAPIFLDTAAFASGGGTLSSTVTVDAAAFSGGGLWTLGSTAVLDAFGSGVSIATATVAIGAGGRVNTIGSGDVVAATAGDQGIVNIGGAAAEWNTISGLTAGGSGSGIVNVRSGGTLAAQGAVAALSLGANAGGAGTLTVSGNGSRATLTGQVNVGAAGSGSLFIGNQATVIIGGSTLTLAQGIDAGQSGGGAGDITVSGSQSLLSNTGAFVVGDSGVGSLAISAGGTVVTTSGGVPGLAALVVGNAAGAAGSFVDVTGAASRLDVTGLLEVGVAGSGAMRVSGGATVTTGSLDAGLVAAGVGQIALTGTGTNLTVLGDATVADDGTGVLSVLDGAAFSAVDLTIGSQGNSSGALIVSGAGSVINLTGSLNIGTALGVGDLTIGPGAAVHASVVNLQGQVVLEGGNLDPTVTIINQGQTAGGNGTIQAGFIVDEGVVQAGGTKPSQRLLIVDGTVAGGGTLTVNGTVQPSNAAGVLQVNASGTLELTGPVLNAATTTFTDNLAQPGTYTINNSVVDVTFADAAGVLLLDDIAGFGGTITSFKGGDAFVVTAGTLSNLGVSNSNTLTFSDSGVHAGSGGIDSIIFGSGISAAGFNIVNGNTVHVACFAAGTRIATEGGFVAVEALAIGDRVVTEDGALEPIVWIGSRAVNCRAHPEPETVWPVRVSAGTFGPGAPARDLLLSPDHAVFVNGVLAPVKLLIDGESITNTQRAAVTYFHVELPRHAIILAEGLPVESYLDIGDRADFGGEGTAIRLFPDFAARLGSDAAWAWETRGAAPLVMAGEALAAARRTVADHLPGTSHSTDTARTAASVFPLPAITRSRATDTDPA